MIINNPRQFKIPDWMLNRSKNYKDGRFFQATSNVLDTCLVRPPACALRRRRRRRRRRLCHRPPPRRRAPAAFCAPIVLVHARWNHAPPLGDRPRPR